MTENKTSDAQIKASRKWEQKNPERTRYLSSRRAARSFIRNYATIEDLEKIEILIEEKRKNIEK